MKLITKIFSLNLVRQKSFDESIEHFSKLSIAEMESVYGGRPLLNDENERERSNQENISQKK